MARIKNDASPLDSLIGAVEGLRYVDAFVKKFASELLVDEFGNPIAIGDVPNEDKARAYINALRVFHRQTYLETTVPALTEAASVTATGTSNTTVDTDLGVEE